MSDPKYHAVLSGWIFIRSVTGLSFIVGVVTGDKKDRFMDGALIRTSALLTSECDVRPGEVVTTRNSRYLLSRD